MNYRHVELLGLKTISADQTETLDIDLSDPISRIILDIRTLHGVGGDATGHPAQAVTLIELVDGSEVLFSLTGMCAQALDIYCTGEHPRGGWLHYLQTTETDMMIALDFGRYLYDPILAFDPTKFRNPQLKITHDISAGGMSPSACKLAIHAEVFDEKKITPTGFLMTKEVKSWSATTNDLEYTDLPLDYPYRKLLVQGLKRGAPPGWVLGNLKLSEDQDKKIVFNDNFRDLIFGLGRQNAFIRETWQGVGQTSQAVYLVTPTQEVHGTATGWAAALATKQADTYDGDGGEFKVIAEGLGNIVMDVSGWAPHAVLCIPFGDQMQIEDWYDVSNIGNLKLTVTDGQTTTTSKIFIQQHRKY
jgi:hypothetical protein